MANAPERVNVVILGAGQAGYPAAGITQLKTREYPMGIHPDSGKVGHALTSLPHKIFLERKFPNVHRSAWHHNVATTSPFQGPVDHEKNPGTSRIYGADRLNIQDG